MESFVYEVVAVRHSFAVGQQIFARERFEDRDEAFVKFDEWAAQWAGFDVSAAVYLVTLHEGQETCRDEVARFGVVFKEGGN